MTVSTLGDHIRKKRLKVGPRQKDLTRRFDVNTDSVACWENNRNQPSLRMVPRIILFLGYDPRSGDSDSLTLGDRVARARQRLGKTQKDLARKLGVDPGTLAKWERGKSEPSASHYHRLFATIAKL